MSLNEPTSCWVMLFTTNGQANAGENSTLTKVADVKVGSKWLKTVQGLQSTVYTDLFVEQALQLVDLHLQTFEVRVLGCDQVVTCTPAGVQLQLWGGTQVGQLSFQLLDAGVQRVRLLPTGVKLAVLASKRHVELQLGVVDAAELYWLRHQLQLGRLLLMLGSIHLALQLSHLRPSHTSTRLRGVVHIGTVPALLLLVHYIYSTAFFPGQPG